MYVEPSEPAFPYPSCAAWTAGHVFNRGRHYWYYNNWDFNVLGELYQRQTGLGLFTALEHQITNPLGFQDFDLLRHARWSYDPAAPRFSRL